MSIAGTTVAAGQLPNAKASLYTVPASTIGHLYVNLVNTAGSAKTARIYIKRSGGSSRQVLNLALGIAGASGSDLRLPRNGNAYKLAAGDIIEGDDNGGGGASIDYTIEGGLET